MKSTKEKIATVILGILIVAACVFAFTTGIDRGDLLFNPKYGLFGIPNLVTIVVVCIVLRIIIAIFEKKNK